MFLTFAIMVEATTWPTLMKTANWWKLPHGKGKRK